MNRLNILFMGRKAQGAEALEWCVQQGYFVSGVLTDSHIPGSKTAEVARKYRIPLFTLESAIQAMNNHLLDFDLAVSYVYWRKIKEPIISQAKHGVINFHPAPLPDYKGTAGYNVAILKGLDKWAVTAHYVDESIDTGPIIELFEFSIDAHQETAKSLEKVSQQFLLNLFKKTVRAVAKGTELPKLDNIGGTYYTRDEMESMKRINPGDDIDRKIRAFWFPPYTGAFIEIDGKKYTLVNEEILKTLVDPDTTFQL